MLKETRFNLPKDDQSASGVKEKSLNFSKHISTSLEIFPSRRMSIRVRSHEFELLSIRTKIIRTQCPD